MKRLTVAAALVFGAFGTPLQAEMRQPRQADGSMHCAPHSYLTGRLFAGYGERHMETRDGEEGRRWELWGNPQTKSWTILVVDGSLACIFSVGDSYLNDFEDLEPQGTAL